jgi:hypothetical protein
LPRRPTAVAIISLILECISSSAIDLTAIGGVREIVVLKASTFRDDNTTIQAIKAHAVVRVLRYSTAAREAEVGAADRQTHEFWKITSNFNGI